MSGIHVASRQSRRSASDPLRTLANVGDLRLLPPQPRKALIAVIGCIAVVTSFILVLDGVVFRSSLQLGYVRFFTQPLFPRMPLLMVLAVTDEMKFRLVLMSVLFVLIAAWRGKVAFGWAIAAIVLSQFVNSAAAVLDDPLYSILRYWAVGCVWGWLYWRHGWLAAVIGHAATHLVLDPALLIVLSGL